MNWLLRNVLVSILLAGGLYSYIYYTEAGEFIDIANEWPGLLLAFLLVYIGTVFLHYIEPFQNQVFPWSRRRALRFMSEVLISIALFAVLGAVYFIFYLEPYILKDAATVEYQESILRLVIILLVLSYLNAQIKFSLYSYNQYTVVQIQNMKILRDQMILRFQTLKSQLSPHFLFNSLNTISSLSYKDTALAEEYIRKLSDMYEYLLKTEQKSLISLEEELQILETFFFMQQIKYKDRIKLKVHISDDYMKVNIPPLTLQLLVENALKHNHISDTFPLHINIYADQSHITVSNSINQINDSDKKHPVESLHIGLNNIRKRYVFFTKHPLEIEQNGAFIVRLPQLKNVSDAA